MAPSVRRTGFSATARYRAATTRPSRRRDPSTASATGRCSSTSSSEALGARRRRPACSFEVERSTPTTGRPHDRRDAGERGRRPPAPGKLTIPMSAANGPPGPVAVDVGRSAGGAGPAVHRRAQPGAGRHRRRAPSRVSRGQAADGRDQRGVQPRRRLHRRRPPPHRRRAVGAHRRLRTAASPTSSARATPDDVRKAELVTGKQRGSSGAVAVLRHPRRDRPPATARSTPGTYYERAMRLGPHRVRHRRACRARPSCAGIERFRSVLLARRIDRGGVAAGPAAPSASRRRGRPRPRRPPAPPQDRRPVRSRSCWPSSTAWSAWTR